MITQNKCTIDLVRFQNTMRYLLDERHRAVISFCDAMCLERECEISSEIHLLHSRKRVSSGIMDTVHAISNRQLEKRIVSFPYMTYG